MSVVGLYLYAESREGVATPARPCASDPITPASRLATRIHRCVYIQTHATAIGEQVVDELYNMLISPLEQARRSAKIR
eukprot:6213797-Pleurochrysis_carterae.AAC.9